MSLNELNGSTDQMFETDYIQPRLWPLSRLGKILDATCSHRKKSCMQINPQCSLSLIMIRRSKVENTQSQTFGQYWHSLDLNTCPLVSKKKLEQKFLVYHL